LRLSLFLLSLSVAALASAAEHKLAPGKTLSLSEDLVLSGDDTLAFIGTADEPCKIVGEGHQIRTAENWRGTFTMQHCRCEGLGKDTFKPEFHAINIRAAGEAKVTIEHCVFDACAGISVNNGGQSTTAFRYNRVLESSIVPVKKDLGDSRESFVARGNSPAQKYFQGNLILRAHCEFDSPKWLIGGDSDKESNILIGLRIKILCRGDTSVIRGNYLHVLMPRNAEYPYWSQVSTLDPHGNLAEHNIIRDGEWIVQFVSGEFRYNVVCDINDHNLLRNGSIGKVHHNLFHVGKPDHPPGSMSAFIYIVYAAKNPGEGMEIYNNTFDGCGIFDPPGVEVCEKGFVKSLRNNAFCNMRLPKYFTLPPAVVRPSWQEKEVSDPDRLGYADYNLFHNPDAKNPKHYTLSVAGKTQRKDAGFALNDVPKAGEIDAEADPKFAAKSPKEFPFTDAEIITGKVTVSEMLAHFRKLYTPGKDSPLIDAGDPADGPGVDIGAIGAGKEDKQDRFGKFAE
jgi:hypothetical protein